MFLPLLHQRCLYDGQIDLVLRSRACHHTCPVQHTQHSTGQHSNRWAWFWFPYRQVCRCRDPRQSRRSWTVGGCWSPSSRSARRRSSHQPTSTKERTYVTIISINSEFRKDFKKTTWIQIFDGLFFMTSDYLSIEGPEYKIRRGDHIPRHALNSDTSSCRHHNRGDLELTNLSHQYWQRSERVPISPPWVPPPIIFSHSDWLKLTN